MLRLRLIAGREISAYASVPSFWAALLMGPILMLITALAGSALHRAPAAPPTRQVIVEAADPATAAAARDALTQASVLEGRPVAFRASRPRPDGRHPPEDRDRSGRRYFGAPVRSATSEARAGAAA